MAGIFGLGPQVGRAVKILLLTVALVILAVAVAATMQTHPSPPFVAFLATLVAVFLFSVYTEVLTQEGLTKYLLFGFLLLIICVFLEYWVRSIAIQFLLSLVAVVLATFIAMRRVNVAAEVGKSIIYGIVTFGLSRTINPAPVQDPSSLTLAVVWIGVVVAVVEVTHQYFSRFFLSMVKGVSIAILYFLAPYAFDKLRELYPIPFALEFIATLFWFLFRNRGFLCVVPRT